MNPRAFGLAPSGPAFVTKEGGGRRRRRPQTAPSNLTTTSDSQQAPVPERDHLVRVRSVRNVFGLKRSPASSPSPSPAISMTSTIPSPLAVPSDDGGESCTSTEGAEEARQARRERRIKPLIATVGPTQLRSNLVSASACQKSFARSRPKVRKQTDLQVQYDSSHSTFSSPVEQDWCERPAWMATDQAALETILATESAATSSGCEDFSPAPTPTRGWSTSSSMTSLDLLTPRLSASTNFASAFGSASASMSRAGSSAASPLILEESEEAMEETPKLEMVCKARPIPLPTSKSITSQQGPIEFNMDPFARSPFSHSHSHSHSISHLSPSRPILSRAISAISDADSAWHEPLVSPSFSNFPHRPSLVSYNSSSTTASTDESFPPAPAHPAAIPISGTRRTSLEILGTLDLGTESASPSRTRRRSSGSTSAKSQFGASPSRSSGRRLSNSSSSAAASPSPLSVSVSSSAGKAKGHRRTRAISASAHGGKKMPSKGIVQQTPWMLGQSPTVSTFLHTRLVELEKRDSRRLSIVEEDEL